jgi:DNA-directed RNA polymerase subunit RPC12/RpoP
MIKYTKCFKCGNDLSVPVTSENPNWTLYCPECGYQEALKQIKSKGKKND